MNRRYLLLALVTALLPGRAVAQTPSAGGEYQVKSAFLQNFTKFVEWPVSVLGPADPLTIGVVGESPILAALESVAGKEVGGHRIEIKSFPDVRSADYCHIVFFAASPRAQTLQQLAAVSTWPSLIVGETSGFARDGATINFVVTEGRVSFEVNVAAAERAGLHVSSRLLRIATVVDVGRTGSERD